MKSKKNKIESKYIKAIWFEKGKLAQIRKGNTSGCCCVISDLGGDDEIIKMCAMHKEIIDKKQAQGYRKGHSEGYREGYAKATLVLNFYGEKYE